MNDVLLTKEGFKKLELELKELQEVTIPSIKTRMANARADGDLSENNAWILSKEEMEIAHLRIVEITKLLKVAKLLKASSSDGDKKVKIGDVVTLQIGDTKMKITIVPTLEADPTVNKLSTESPIGKAVIGKSVGEETTLTTPAGEQVVKILSKD